MTETPAPAARYKAFGLRVRSCLPLPEMLPVPEGDAGPDDIEIVFGDFPDELPGATAHGLRYQVAPGKFQLRVDRVAHYLIDGPSRVVIRRAPDADDDDVRLFLLASAFGALLHLRQDLVLHGSAIVHNGAAVVFLGISGAGKSTLATALRKRGYPILTDDLCVVREGADGVPAAQPGFPQSKLWLDSLKRLDISAEGLKPIRRKVQKRAVPIIDAFASDPLPIRKLYVLRPIHKDEIKITPVEGPQKLTVLRNQTYRFRFLEGLGGKAIHFKNALKLAQTVPLAIAVRPTEMFKLDELAEQIEADFKA